MLGHLLSLPFRLVGWVLDMTGHLVGFVLGLVLLVVGIVLCMTVVGLVPVRRHPAVQPGRGEEVQKPLCLPSQ